MILLCCFLLVASKPVGKEVPAGLMIVNDLHGSFSVAVVQLKDMFSYTRALATRISCLFSLTFNFVRKEMLMNVIGGVSILSDSGTTVTDLGFVT